MGHSWCGACNCDPCQCKKDNDGLVVGKVVPARGHPSPHAPHDKTDEYDMREVTLEGRPTGEPRLGGVEDATQTDSFGKRFNAVSKDSRTLMERIPKPVPTPKPLSVKDTNPKDAVGTKKWRQYCTVPTTVIWELGVAMLEGARKYGRHNYRIAGVRASVYVDAAKGHIDQWWEGEDIDEESKLSHITKAMASLLVLRDAMIQDRWLDDRPPKTDLVALRADLQEAVDGIFERVPVAKDAYLEGDQYDTEK